MKEHPSREAELSFNTIMIQLGKYDEKSVEHHPITLSSKLYTDEQVKEAEKLCDWYKKKYLTEK